MNDAMGTDKLADAISKLDTSSADAPPRFAFYSPPPPAGFWIISPSPYLIQWPVSVRPTDEQIKNTEQLLGWKWIDK